MMPCCAAQRTKGGASRGSMRAASAASSRRFTAWPTRTARPPLRRRPTTRLSTAAFESAVTRPEWPARARGSGRELEDDAAAAGLGDHAAAEFVAHALLDEGDLGAGRDVGGREAAFLRLQAHRVRVAVHDVDVGQGGTFAAALALRLA